MCGIPSRGLFQNRDDACDESCSNVVCSRVGAQNAGRAEEAGGLLRFATGQAVGTPANPDRLLQGRGFGKGFPASQVHLRCAFYS